MAGFGGAIKNISIGIDSSEGKCLFPDGGLNISKKVKEKLLCVEILE